MLYARNYEISNNVCIYKYIDDQTYGVENFEGMNKYISLTLIASLLTHEHIGCKGPTPKELKRIIFKEF